MERRGHCTLALGMRAGFRGQTLRLMDWLRQSNLVRGAPLGAFSPAIITIATFIAIACASQAGQSTITFPLSLSTWKAGSSRTLSHGSCRGRRHTTAIVYRTGH